MTPTDYLTFFLAFFKASLITFAGQAAIPVLNQELVQTRGWATAADLSTALAIGRICPGPTGMFVVSLGYLVLGWPGAILAMVGSTLPPLVVVPLAPIIRRSLHRPWVGGVMQGIGLASAGLLVSVGVGIVANGATVVSASLVGDITLAAMGVALSWSGKVHPIAVMGLAAVCGVVLSQFGI